jgi:CRISPR-associated endonuclease Cas3-HD
LLHDLGKYADQFQRRLKDPTHEPGRDHWTAGAVLLLKCYKHLGLMPALAVQGHHRGLGVLEDDQGAYLESLAQTMRDFLSVTEPNLNLLKGRFGGDGFSFPQVREGFRCLGHDADNMLDTRMLFSALVDADFIETEAHFEGDCVSPRKYRPDGLPLEPAKALDVVTTAVWRLAAKSQAQSEV